MISQLQAGDRADMTRAVDAVPWWKADPADPDWETHLFEEAALQLLGVRPRVDRLAQALLTAYPRPLTFAESVPILSG